MTAPTLAALAGGLALLLAGLRAWWRRRADARAITRLEADVAQAKGQRDVAVMTQAATVAVDDRQAAAREVGEAAVRDPAVVDAPTPGARIDAATDLLRRRVDAAAKVKRLTAARRRP